MISSSLRFSLLVAALGGVAGCATRSSSAAGGEGGGPGGGASSAGVGGAWAVSSSGGGGPAFDAGGPVQTYSAAMGPIQMASGDDATNCVVLELGNTEGGFVRRLRSSLSLGSHHMIVYATTDPLSPTPTPCVSLAGILAGDQPLFVAQPRDSTFAFPVDGSGTPVGFALQPNQHVKVEYHTINPTGSPLAATGTVFIDTIPSTAAVTESGIAVWGTAKIDIPPNGSFSTPIDFQTATPGTTSFAVTTHQHELGTDMKIWYSAAPGDTSDVVADDTDWVDPPLHVLSPPLDFPDGGAKGLSYQCSWVNPTPSEIGFGEAANQEMCLLWQHYYPNQGFQVCVDGACH